MLHCLVLLCQERKLCRLPQPLSKGIRQLGIQRMAIIAHITDRHPELIPSSPESRDRYWEILSLLGTTMYPAYHRQHHPYYYGPEAAFNEMRRLAQVDQSALFNHVDAMLTPYLCGDILTAADFYFYMMSRWDMNKKIMLDGRPKLKTFINKMRTHPSLCDYFF